VRQALCTHREHVFPAIQEDDDRYFPRHHFGEFVCKVAVLQEEVESARLVETVPLVISLNSALN